MKIWKEVLEITDKQQTELPYDAQILSIQNQGEQICMWYSTVKETHQPKVMRSFAVIGTGNHIPEHLVSSLEYINTIQLMGGSLVFHVFEIVKNKS